MGKIGRPKENIYDSANNLIVGLSLDVKNKTYFASYKDDQSKHKKQYFGRDKASAISKYLNWREKRKGGKLTKFEKPNYLPSIPATIRLTLSDEINDIIEKAGIDPAKVVTGAKVEVISIPDEYIWQRACDLIWDNPTLAAQKLKIPALANPQLLQDLAKPHTLAEIGQNYFGKIEFKNLTGNPKLEHDKVKIAWDRFVKSVGVRTVVELTKDKIKTYYESLYSEYESRDLSTTWLKGFMERVIRVLNSAIKDLDHASDIVDVKARCNSVFKMPKTIVKNKPKIIPKDALAAILDVSTAEEKAMWLVSLNLAYYVADLVELPKDAIDLHSRPACEIVRSYYFGGQ